ncbi:hypothetical protein MHU86_21287 [Fragilaria crotonensis]|nr:hypothetical protein MHU86_21287 [Fragilaria crotonensis]
MDGITFTECANHLSAIVSELPDHQISRKVSATDSKSRGVGAKHIRGGGRSASNPGSKRKGINMPDGTIWTGHYSDWDKMSDADKQTVMDTRKKNRAKGTMPNKKKGSDLKSQIADLKRSIAAIQSKTSDDDGEKSDESDVPDNAGDAFGGRQKKRQKRNDARRPFPQLNHQG